MKKRENTAVPDRVGKKSAGNRTFLERWSQRKIARNNRRQITSDNTEHAPTPVQTTNSAEVKLPAVESLHENSNIGAFLAEDVSEALQRQALRKLFHFNKFNICDGLDDYAEDYTIFEPLESLLAVKDKLSEFGDSLSSEQDQIKDSTLDPVASSTDTDTSSQASVDKEQEKQD